MTVLEITSVCDQCDGLGMAGPCHGRYKQCDHCLAAGFSVDNPGDPCEYAAGSLEKIAVLAARYAAGVPLWNEDDSHVVVGMYPRPRISEQRFSLGLPRGGKMVS